MTNKEKVKHLENQLKKIKEKALAMFIGVHGEYYANCNNINCQAFIKELEKIK